MANWLNQGHGIKEKQTSFLWEIKIFGLNWKSQD